MSQKKEKILIVSVHPDDETIACGGTILKYKKLGHSVNCIFVTNGNEFQEKTIEKLNQFYGFDKSVQLGLPEMDLDNMPLGEIIVPLSKAISEIQPEVIYIPNRSDVHSDHRTIFSACQACVKSFRYPFIKKVLMMHVISETDFASATPENTFIPTVFENISEQFEMKTEALEIFKSELLPYPYTRNVNTMNAFNRYMGSLINCEYAEVFMLLKEIND
jgi:LmbE family N-acetylglucosaminyl deacetylase